MHLNSILAFDGHDGSGKTTLCKIFAEKLNGIYIRPFGGDNGNKLIEAANSKNYPLVLKIGFDSIREEEKKYKNSILVFDRHWMTVLSLVPKNYWKEWQDFPPAILCWCDLATTKNRLASRNEEKFNDDYHNYYLDRYIELKDYKNSAFINTGEHNIKSCLKQLSLWIETNKIIQ